MKKQEFTFEIWKDDNVWIAQDKETGMITSGIDKDDLFDMIADTYKCVLGIKTPWYRHPIQFIYYRVFNFIFR